MGCNRPAHRAGEQRPGIIWGNAYVNQVLFNMTESIYSSTYVHISGTQALKYFEPQLHTMLEKDILIVENNL